MCRMNGASVVGQQLTASNLMNNNNSTNASYPTGIYVLPGYSWIASLSQSVWYDWGRVIMSAIYSAPGGYTRVTPRLDGNGQVVLDYQYTHRDDYKIGSSYIAKDHIYGNIRCKVISWPSVNAPPENRYGIQLSGINNLFAIPDQSKISHLVFKGDITIWNGWTPGVIDSRLTMDNCVCFFYTQDLDLAIGIRFNGSSYSVWGKSGSSYGVALSSAYVRVCIFANIPPGDPERYGISIRNNGNLIWNSTQDPLIRPAIVDMSGGLYISGSQFFRPGIATPFRRPMFCPACIGGGVGTWTYYNGSQPDASRVKATVSSYVSSDGMNLYHGFGGREADMFGDYSSGFPAWNYPEVLTSQLPVLVIDGENHFSSW